MIVIRDVPGDSLHSLTTRGERLAFWINAYNTLVIQGIEAFTIRESVWEVSDFFDRIAYGVGPHRFTANDIEHGVLRANRPNPLTGVAAFAPDDPRLTHAVSPPDPRIHFALNCGPRSCPPVRRYEAARVEAQLDAAARAFVGINVALRDGQLICSPLFGWFASDFADWPGGLRGFLAGHLEEGPAREALLSRKTPITWSEYDWRLPAPGAIEQAL